MDNIKTKIFLVTFGLLSLINGCRSGGEKKAESVQTVSSQGVSSVVKQEDSIHKAAIDGNLGLVSSLLDKGCKVDSIDQDGRTPLIYAAYNGNISIIKKLLEKGATVNIRDINGRTALMMAASGPFTEAVKMLLENYADPNITDREEHFSALMYAASEGQIENVRILLAHNADPFLKDIDGDDALTFARKNNHPEAATLLQSFLDKINK